MAYRFIEVHVENEIAEVHLNRMPLNDLTPDFMTEIAAVHAELDARSDVKGVLLCSRAEKFFCNGLEPKYMLEQTVDGRGEVFLKLLEMCRAVYAFSKPELSVIKGHAMAGGAVLAALTDFRFMGDGKYRYSFSEVRVGLTIPHIIMELAASVVGTHNLPRVIMAAEAFHPPEAKAVGLVDQVYPHDKVQAEGRRYLESLVDFPLASIRSVKKNIRAPLLKRFQTVNAAELAEFRSFLSGNFEEGLRAVMERRRPKFQD
ncbi:MAG: enoyl-CoA hydratase/isomerase family protein [Spirochaetia bacterium]|nr:enoyl-CoA hydratase/isomerase family protein [Spirochaetia bacterium]